MCYIKWIIKLLLLRKKGKKREESEKKTVTLVKYLRIVFLVTDFGIFNVEILFRIKKYTLFEFVCPECKLYYIVWIKCYDEIFVAPTLDATREDREGGLDYRLYCFESLFSKLV